MFPISFHEADDLSKDCLVLTFNFRVDADVLGEGGNLIYLVHVADLSHSPFGSYCQL